MYSSKQNSIGRGGEEVILFTLLEGCDHCGTYPGHRMVPISWHLSFSANNTSKPLIWRNCSHCEGNCYASWTPGISNLKGVIQSCYHYSCIHTQTNYTINHAHTPYTFAHYSILRQKQFILCIPWERYQACLRKPTYQPHTPYMPAHHSIVL